MGGAEADMSSPRAAAIWPCKVINKSIFMANAWMLLERYRIIRHENGHKNTSSSRILFPALVERWTNNIIYKREN